MNLKILNLNDFIFFSTRDYASYSDIDVSSASRQLSNLEKQNVLTKISRGIWANSNHPYFNPYGAVPHLVGLEQGYISFLTALSKHGIISQIPQSIQIAYTGHTRELESPIANYEFITLSPEFMKQGMEWSKSNSEYMIADPEKALLDTLYISTRKGNRFSVLPELDLSNFNKKYFHKLLNETVKDEKIKKAILKRLTQYNK